MEEKNHVQVIAADSHPAGGTWVQRAGHRKLSHKELAMSRVAVLLLILTTCAPGCRHVSRLNVSAIPPPPCPAAAPIISPQWEPAKVAPDAIPAEKNLANPNQAETQPRFETPMPTNNVGTIASSKKETTCDS